MFFKMFKWTALLLSIVIVITNANDIKHTEIIEHLFNKNDLKTLKNVRPNFEQNKTVNVNVTMYVMDIGLTSPDSMNFMIDFYFRQMWYDPRLMFENDFENVNYVVMTTKQSESIWLPDTFISTAKQLDTHAQNSFSDGNRFIRIKSNGQVFYSHRLTAIVNCANRIGYFPSDHPVCKLEIESYGFSASDILYKWIDDSVLIDSSPPSLIGFKIIKNNSDDNKNDHNVIEHKEERIKLSTGSYSRLIAKIHLERKCGYFLFHIYLPSIMLVILSWMSLCIDPIERSTARILIGIFTSLGILIIMFGVTTTISRPNEYSLTAIDIYVFVCMLMIFISFVSSVSRCPHGDNGKSYQLEQGQIVRQHSMNLYSRIVMPMIFILFNISYWLTLWLAK